jgi:hypothetical protein
MQTDENIAKNDPPITVIAVSVFVDFWSALFASMIVRAIILAPIAMITQGAAKGIVARAVLPATAAPNNAFSKTHFAPDRMFAPMSADNAMLIFSDSCWVKKD